jgi:hypothetical protein
MEEECGKLLKDFFRARRKENKQKVNWHLSKTLIK